MTRPGSDGNCPVCKLPYVRDGQVLGPMYEATICPPELNMCLPCWSDSNDVEDGIREHTEPSRVSRIRDLINMPGVAALLEMDELRLLSGLAAINLKKFNE